MATSRTLTPLILCSFFCLIILSLIAASAWSRAQATESQKADAIEEKYFSEEDKLPVIDAVIEKTSG